MKHTLITLSEMVEGEDWRIINGFESYLVSNRGRIYSLKRNSILKYSLNYGYPRLRLTDENGVRKSMVIHRLVAESFIPNINNKPQVNHINGIKDDNNVINLEWVTCSENIKHAFDNGLKVISEECRKASSERMKKRTGDKHPQSIKVICNKTKEIFNSIREASKNSGLKEHQLRYQLTKGDKNKTNYSLLHS